jgi:hypothetical protein
MTSYHETVSDRTSARPHELNRDELRIERTIEEPRLERLKRRIDALEADQRQKQVQAA